MARAMLRWSRAEEEYLRRVCKSKSFVEIAVALNRSLPSVYGKVEQLGCWRQARPRWTPEEERFLREHYGKWPLTRLAERFSISVPAVIWRANKLGLYRRRRPVSGNRRWTGEEEATLNRLIRSGVPVREVARSLGRGENSVRIRLRTLKDPVLNPAPKST